MDTIFDYLAWRGDLSFSNSPFNEVDYIILCQLSYINFDHSVSDKFQNRISKGITLAEISKQISCKEAHEDKKLQRIFIEAGKTKRFGSLIVCGYTHCFDEEIEMQFAAITFLSPNNNAYIVFRGTDNTRIGWKEDFNMICRSPVPSQKESLIYLEKAVKKIPLKYSISVGGHSKGGNLALYSASNIARKMQNRIKSIYCFDAPGFDSKLFDISKIQPLLPKIKSFVPQDSIIGMLLDHPEKYNVVLSFGDGIMQHDPFTWKVRGPNFLGIETTSENSKIIAMTMKKWLTQLDITQRKQFVDAVFTILEHSKVETPDDLIKFSGLKILNLVKEFTFLDKNTRKIVIGTLQLLMDSAHKPKIQVKEELEIDDSE